MKRIITFFTTVLLLVATACSANPNSEATQEIVNEYNNIEIIRWMSDRNIHRTFENLIESAELVVIGEFTEDATPTINYGYDLYFEKDVITNYWSTNTILIHEVLKGNIDTEKISVCQNYAVIEQESGKLGILTSSDLTPMNKGDQWIFFFGGDKEGSSYWLTGDYTGRYPIPNERLSEICTRVSAINSELQEWLFANSKLITSSEELETLIEKGEYIYFSSDGENSYHISSQEQWNQLYVILSEVEKYRSEINPLEFGVYENSSINLWLYSDILEYFSLS
ncbi:MAG: hypothetical protein FWG70_08915 [Oscillospiraceae bacterium]|nr:hypothetical protein [Oscillospiraceae bacterium]